MKYNVKKIDGTLIQVLCEDGSCVGYISKGFLSTTRKGVLKIKCIRRWFVIGHEYISFNKMNDAVDALTDYCVYTVMRMKAYNQLNKDQARYKILKGTKKKNGNTELLQMKKEFRKDCKNSREDLLTFNKRSSLSNTILENV